MNFEAFIVESGETHFSPTRLNSLAKTWGFLLTGMWFSQLGYSLPHWEWRGASPKMKPSSTWNPSYQAWYFSLKPKDKCPHNKKKQTRVSRWKTEAIVSINWPQHQKPRHAEATRACQGLEVSSPGAPGDPSPRDYSALCLLTLKGWQIGVLLSQFKSVTICYWSPWKRITSPSYSLHYLKIIVRQMPNPTILYLQTAILNCKK